MKRKPKIGDAKKLCEELGARGVIVLVFDREGFGAVSYGETKRECAMVGAVTDLIADDVAEGRLAPWRSGT